MYLPAAGISSHVHSICSQQGQCDICFAALSSLCTAQHTSKHETSTQCCINVGPSSRTVDQHWKTLGQCFVFETQITACTTSWWLAMKWKFRPPLCTYSLNWARRTSWGWWVEWDDTVLQTQDSKLKPWRSEAEHATSRSRRFPTILSFTRGWGRNIFVSFKRAETGNRTPNSGVKGSGSNQYIRAPALMAGMHRETNLNQWHNQSAHSSDLWPFNS